MELILVNVIVSVSWVEPNDNEAIRRTRRCGTSIWTGSQVTWFGTDTVSGSETLYWGSPASRLINWLSVPEGTPSSDRLGYKPHEITKSMITVDLYIYIYICITLTLMLAQGSMYLPVLYAEVWSLQHKSTFCSRDFYSALPLVFRDVIQSTDLSPYQYTGGCKIIHVIQGCSWSGRQEDIGMEKLM